MVGSAAVVGVPVAVVGVPAAVDSVLPVELDDPSDPQPASDSVAVRASQGE